MEVVRRHCGFLNGFDVSAKGSKERVSLAWIEDLSISLQCFYSNLIDVFINDSNESNGWRFTGFYGMPFV